MIQNHSSTSHIAEILRFAQDDNVERTGVFEHFRLEQDITENA
jgi:hypothetical protein